MFLGTSSKYVSERKLMKDNRSIIGNSPISTSSDFLALIYKEIVYFFTSSCQFFTKTSVDHGSRRIKTRLYPLSIEVQKQNAGVQTLWRFVTSGEDVHKQRSAHMFVLSYLNSFYSRLCNYVYKSSIPL